MPYSAALQQITREHDYDNRGMQLSNNKFHSDYTGWIKKISCCTVVDISKARQ